MQTIAVSKNSHSKMNWLFIITMVTGLYLTTKVNYLLFHSLIELFSIIVASTVFIITWNSVKYLKNPYLITVGISYLFIGVLDLLHTLSYKGMPIFTDYDYYANQLWIAARSLESCTLLAAFLLLFVQKSIRAGFIFLFYSLVTSLLIASIFYWKIFPVCFIAGKGLTDFKVYSEYVICTILVASIVLLMKNKGRFADSVYKLLLLSMSYTIISELAFTFYIDNYGISNLIGHYFKLFSFMMIYRAIVATGIEEPYQLIFKELNQTNEKLHKEIDSRVKIETELESEINERKSAEEALKLLNQELETRAEIRTQELRVKDEILLLQGRQAAMGEMIGNIAHQWRQPLNTLGLVVQQLLLFYDMGEFNRELLEGNVNLSKGLIKHMSTTIDDFRNFFQPDKEKVEFKVTDAIAGTLSLIEDSFKNQHISVEVVAKDDPVIFGYQNEYGQVLINILNNARDALTERGTEDPKVTISIVAEDYKAVVIVSDNAGGIPEEIMEKIFDPYFTTKGPQLGTGVGLFMSKTIIEKNMGGRLSARNTEDGAEFRIEV